MNQYQLLATPDRPLLNDQVNSDGHFHYSVEASSREEAWAMFHARFIKENPHRTGIHGDCVTRMTSNSDSNDDWDQ
jgi:hypothetical protein